MSCYVFKSRQLIEDRAPVDFIYGCPISTCDAVTWLKDRVSDGNPSNGCWGDMPFCRQQHKYWDYPEVSNISYTKCQNLYVSHFVLQLSLPNPMKPGVKSRMKMYLEQPRQAVLQLHLSDQQSHNQLRCNLYQRFYGSSRLDPDLVGQRGCRHDSLQCLQHWLSSQCEGISISQWHTPQDCVVFLTTVI